MFQFNIYIYIFALYIFAMPCVRSVIINLPDENDHCTYKKCVKASMYHASLADSLTRTITAPVKNISSLV